MGWHNPARENESKRKESKLSADEIVAGIIGVLVLVGAFILVSRLVVVCG